MKRTSTILCLLLALAMMLGMLAGCGSSTASAAASEAAAESAAEEVAEEAAAEEAPAAEASAAEEFVPVDEAATAGNVSGQESEDGIASLTAEGAPEGKITFPLDEQVELSFWFSPESDGYEVMKDFHDNYALQTNEELTNVYLNLTEVSMAASEEQFNLLIASNDLPDIIQMFGSYYTKGIDNAMDEDLILDLTDMLADYAPNYNYLRENNAELKKSSTEDSGRVGSFYFLIGDADLGPRNGMWIRQDWLEEQGLEVPTTYDEMYEVLKAFQSAYNTPMTLYMTEYGYFDSQTLVGGYDVGIGFYNEDGTVKYGPIEDGFYDYLVMMNQWYADGLISSDFTTITSMNIMFDPTDIVTSKCGVWNANYRGDDSWKNNATDESFTPLAIADMTKTGTEQIHVGGKGSNVDRYGCVVSAECEQADVAVAWIDWWYSEEGTMLSSYGVEGETFNYNEDGQPIYTDLILNNEQGSARAMRNIYTGMSFAFRVYRVVTSGYDNGYDKLDRGTWDTNRDNAWDISNFIAMTSDEGDEYSTIMSDIETYVEENVPKFIIGARDLSEWDTYVQDIIDMGIEDAIAIKTAAVERYEAR